MKNSLKIHTCKSVKTWFAGPHFDCLKKVTLVCKVLCKSIKNSPRY